MIAVKPLSALVAENVPRFRGEAMNCAPVPALSLIRMGWPAGGTGPRRDDLSSTCHLALHPCLSMIGPAHTWIGRCRKRRTVFALRSPGLSNRALHRLRGVQEARHLVAQRGGVFRQLAGRAQHVLGGPACGVGRVCDGVDVAGDIRRAGCRLAAERAGTPVRKAEMARSVKAREN